MVPLTMQSWASAYRQLLQPPRMQSTAHDETRTAREGKKQEERYFRFEARPIPKVATIQGAKLCTPWPFTLSKTSLRHTTTPIFFPTRWLQILLTQHWKRKRRRRPVRSIGISPLFGCRVGCRLVGVGDPGSLVILNTHRLTRPSTIIVSAF